MTQREYIAASLKIIGLVVLIYGCLTASLNLLRSGHSYYQSKQVTTTYADSIPTEMKKEFDKKNKSDSMGQRLMSIMYLSRIPANLVVALFGLALIKRDRWFTTFLIGKDK
mgnify:CR=1 FL=1